jgi:hypothetical protein
MSADNAVMSTVGPADSPNIKTLLTGAGIGAGIGILDLADVRKLDMELGLHGDRYYGKPKMRGIVKTILAPCVGALISYSGVVDPSSWHWVERVFGRMSPTEAGSLLGALSYVSWNVLHHTAIGVKAALGDQRAQGVLLGYFRGYQAVVDDSCVGSLDMREWGSGRKIDPRKGYDGQAANEWLDGRGPGM